MGFTSCQSSGQALHRILVRSDPQISEDYAGLVVARSQRLLRTARVVTARQLGGRTTTAIRILFDIVAWTFAILLATFIRLSGDLQSSPKALAVLFPIVWGIQLFVGYIVGLYRRRWRYGSFDEVAALVTSAIVTTAILATLNNFVESTRPIPQSAVVFGGLVGLITTAAVRYIWRIMLSQTRRPNQEIAKRALIFGAGEAGQQLIAALLRNPNSQYFPVGILDDNPLTQRLSIMGVSVLGTRDSISDVKRQTNAEIFMIAIPSGDPAAVSDLARLAEAAKLKVKILPPTDGVLDRQIDATDIRDISQEDLLRRQQVSIDLEQVTNYVTNQRVLVTGAGGSIGSELCRQLSQFSPSELIMLDRDESALHEVELSIYGRAMLDKPRTVLCDIRDAKAVDSVFRERRPQVVFHAAALKHLPLLEQYPAEAYKTNVHGSLNVLSAAKRFDTNVFLNISTDKAANPISVLGYSKRIAERLTASFGTSSSKGTFISVRFGNVLGSRGSVLTTFREQIANGGPVTVTHNDVTRYFMTISEAVQLVVQAGAIGLSGEVLVLDMGTPVRIYEVAEQLIERSGQRIDIEITGLRVGEKMHEELFGDLELDERPKHPLISHVIAPPLDPDALVDTPADPRDFMMKLV